MRRVQRPRAVIVGLALLLAIVAAMPVHATGDSLRAQVEALAVSEGFMVSGLEYLGDQPAKGVAGGTPARRLGALLRGYDYIVLHDSEGRVAELRISGLNAPASTVPQRYAVPTTRRGRHHVVDAVLAGPNGMRQRLALIVDTGATSMVLPNSMIVGLGYDAGELEDGWSQTAGGRVPVKLGSLGLVKVGTAMARDVAVAFIEDDKIGGQALLGMSFLGRFRLTVDDDAERIILMAK